MKMLVSSQMPSVQVVSDLPKATTFFGTELRTSHRYALGCCPIRNFVAICGLKSDFTRPCEEGDVTGTSSVHGRLFSKIYQHCPVLTCHMVAGSASWLHSILEELYISLKRVVLSVKTRDMTIEAGSTPGGCYHNVGARRSTVTHSSCQFEDLCDGNDIKADHLCCN